MNNTTTEVEIIIMISIKEIFFLSIFLMFGFAINWINTLLYYNQV